MTLVALVALFIGYRLSDSPKQGERVLAVVLMLLALTVIFINAWPRLISSFTYKVY